VVLSTATFQEFADTWLDSAELRPRTLETHRNNLNRHVYPVIGRLRLNQISEDSICLVMSSMRRKGLSARTIKGALTPTGRVLSIATRRGLIASNPLTQLDKTERPSVTRREMRVLDRGEVKTLLAAATPAYRPLLAAAIFLGLRQSELLGLKWGDVAFEKGLVRVRRALNRDGSICELKTSAAVRDVILIPSLAQRLAAHKLGPPSAETPALYSRRGLDARCTGAMSHAADWIAPPPEPESTELVGRSFASMIAVIRSRRCSSLREPMLHTCRTSWACESCHHSDDLHPSDRCRRASGENDSIDGGRLRGDYSRQRRCRRAWMTVSALCPTLHTLAATTWRHMTYQAQHGFRLPDERAATDYNMIEMAIRHDDIVRVRLFGTSEEARTGADWHWWVTDDKRYLSLLVQAKKLVSDVYAQLGHVVASSRTRQIDLLIDVCRRSTAATPYTGSIPMYVFYNGDFGTRFPLDRCENPAVTSEQRGCTVALAEEVRAVFDTPSRGANPSLAAIGAIAWPWRCLFCCERLAQVSIVDRIMQLTSEETVSSDGVETRIWSEDEVPEYVKLMATEDLQPGGDERPLFRDSPAPAASRVAVIFVPAQG
jgi:integrase